MVATTVFLGVENAPTGDFELDSLLAELRDKSGKNFQCDVIDYHEPRFLRKSVRITQYTLMVHVGGVLPWQILSCASGEDAKPAKAYIIGYLSGLEQK